MVCKYCGGAIHENQKFCPYCGKETGQGVEQSADIRVKFLNQYIVCPSCHTKVCGYLTEDGKLYCHNCGTCVYDARYDKNVIFTPTGMTSKTPKAGGTSALDFVLIVIGAIFSFGGLGLGLYGNSVNRDFLVQAGSFLQNGKINTGDPYINAGILIGVLGIALLAAGLIMLCKHKMFDRR